MFTPMQSINSPPPAGDNALGDMEVKSPTYNSHTNSGSTNISTSESVSAELTAAKKILSQQSARVTTARDALLTAHDALRHRVTEQQQQIEEALAVRHLMNKIEEFKNWSTMNMNSYCNVDTEKKRRVSLLADGNRTTSLGAVEREAQDFKAIHEEIKANEAPFFSIKDSAKQYSNPQLEQALTGASSVWESLLAAVEDKSQSLQIRRMRVEHDQKLQWCSTQVRVLTTSEDQGNLGSTVDGCETLKQRNTTLRTDLAVVASKIDLVLEESASLQEDQDGYKTTTINDMNELKVTLKQLLNRSNERTVELEQASRVLEAVGECNHFRASAAKKIDQLSSVHLGSGPREATMLLEMHATHASDLVAFIERVREHFTLCKSLPSPDIEQTNALQQLTTELETMLQQLDALEKQRLKDLTHSKAVEEFLSDASRISQWMQRLEDTISADDKTAATTTSAATALQTQLTARMAEFEANKAEVDGKLIPRAQLLRGDTRHNPKINETVHDLHVKMNGVESVGQAKAAELSQWTEQLEFSARVASVDHWVASVSTSIKSAKLGDDIADVCRLQRVHESLEKRVEGQQTVMSDLTTQLNRLTIERHPAVADLNPLLEGIKAKRGELEAELAQRKVMLEARLEIFQFQRDTAELRGWIINKQQVVNIHLPKGVAVSDEINTHGTFMEELSISTAVPDIKTKAAALSYTLACIEEISIQADVTLIEEEWEKLLKEGQIKTKYLADHSLFESFENEASQLKELLSALDQTAQCPEVGTNLTEFKAAHEAFIVSLFEKLGAIKMRICKFYTLAEKVEEELRDLAECRTVPDCVKAMKALENTLNLSIENRRQILEKARLCHIFVSDANEVIVRIEERTTVLEVLDLGDDLTTAELLQRQQLTFERELDGLKAQVISLGKRHAQLEDVLGDKTDQAARTIQLTWAAMGEKLISRRTLIDDSLALQTFLHQCRIAVESIEEISAIMDAESVESMVDTDGTKALQQRHSERRKEIDAWGQKLEALIVSGTQLCDQKHFASDRVTENMEQLRLSLSDVGDRWEALEANIHDHHNGLDFGRTADDISALLSNKHEQIQSVDEFDDVEIEELAKMLQEHDDHVVHLAAISKRNSEFEAKTSTFLDSKNTNNNNNTNTREEREREEREREETTSIGLPIRSLLIPGIDDGHLVDMIKADGETFQA